MSETRAIASSTAYQVIGKGFSIVLGVVSSAFMMRYLGLDAFGDFTTIIAVVSLCATLADLGLYMYLVTEISREGADRQKIIGNVFGLRMAVSVLGLIAGLVVMWLLPTFSMTMVVGAVIAAVAYFTVSVNQLFVGIFQSHLRTLAVAIGELVGRGLLIATTIVVIYVAGGLYGMLWAVVAGAVGNYLVLYYMSKRHVRVVPLFNLGVWKRVLVLSWPVGATVVLNLIYFRIDTIFLHWLKEPSDVGVYGSAYKILEVLVAFPAIFAGLLTPLFAKYAFTNWPKLQMVMQRGFDYLLMAAVPLVVASYVLADKIVVFIGGEEYQASGGVLRVLMVATAIIFMGHIFANAVVALKLQRKIVWGYAAAALFAVLTNFIFIPHFSYYGAAWTTVATELLMVVINVIVISILIAKKTNRHWWQVLPSFHRLPKIILASAVMGAMLWYFSRFTFTVEVLGRPLDLFVLVLVVLGVLSYVMVAWLVKLVTINELKHLRSPEL